MNEYPDPEWAWKDGDFVPYGSCTIHVRTQAVMVAASVFEGIKAYWNNSEQVLYLFRLDEHLQRLRESMKIMRMSSGVPDGLGRICAELLARNGFSDDVHMMPTAYVGLPQGNVALARGSAEGMFITAVSRPRSPLLDKGMKICVSSWGRISDNTVPPRVKAAGNYQNGRLALNEAWANGYDNALMLNATGTIAEAPGSCVMIVRNGKVCTPPVTAGILESITRDTLIQLFAEKMNLRVEERPIDRTELYIAEEIFLCGSGMEVMPVVSVDQIPVGKGRMGPLTQRIQAAYFEVATGVDASHAEWRTAVPRS